MKISSIEKECLTNFNYILCIDEVGRGPLAGPLTVAGILLNYEILNNISKLQFLNDSKKVTSKRRNLLEEQIINIVKYYKIYDIEPNIIDKINIYEATKLGIINICKKILEENLYIENICILIDGTFSNFDKIFSQTLKIKYELKFIIKGDTLCPGIACASILAKCHRDRIMINYDKIYSKYEFKKHKGYGTKNHIKNIEEYGPCNIHRKSFNPVKDMIKKNNYKNNNKIKKINVKKFDLYYDIACFIEKNPNNKYYIIIKKYNISEKSISYYIKISKRIKKYVDLVGRDNLEKLNIKVTQISKMNNKDFQDFINNFQN